MNLLILLGIFIFQNGFLLKRKTLLNKSQIQTSHLQLERPSQIILVLIDALRHDFLVYNESLNDQGLYYRNQMPALRTLTEKENNSFKDGYYGKLFHFIADPPTTTMQRLKAIFTGSLPLFMEALQNFDSELIHEEHLFHQTKHQMVMMGDDTWEKLFGKEKFKEMFAYDSFDVYDLDTVDSNILSHFSNYLLTNSEYQEEKPKMLIAHFLGVDHCGHRYGPQHPEMSRKLSQMNQFLNETISNMHSDSLLFVFGDHGMDEKGDHGGDSQLEIDAGLWVYSKNKKFKNNGNYKNDKVSQIDLLPTLSFLLGLNIPFNNLGKPILSLLPFDSQKQMIQAMSIQLEQILIYLKTCEQLDFELEFSQELSNLLSLLNDYPKIDDINRLIRLLKTFSLPPPEDNLNTEDIVNTIDRLLELNQTRMRKIWATFNPLHMLLGIFFILVSLLEPIMKSYLLVLGYLITSAGLAIQYHALLDSMTAGLIIFGFIYLLLQLYFRSKQPLSFKLENLTSYSFLYLPPLLILFSNSFIVHESQFSFYLLQSFIFLYSLPQSLSLGLLMLFINRLANWSNVCREESIGCYRSFSSVYYNDFSKLTLDL